MEKKEMKTAIGTVCLDNIEFGEMLIDLFLDIKSIPDSIREKIYTVMEAAKAEQLRNLEECCKDDKQFARDSEKIDLDIWLHISISNSGLSSRIETDLIDEENDTMWACVSIDVDLSEYLAELEPVIVRAFAEKITGMRSMDSNKEGL